MKLLLDSQIVIAIAHRELHSVSAALDRLVQAPPSEIFVSTASLWEIAIKHRLGKLALQIPLPHLPNFLISLRYRLLAVDERHAIEDLVVQPPTRDPFDKLFLAQCQVEGLSLVTVDRALVGHPLAWRAP